MSFRACAALLFALCACSDVTTNLVDEHGGGSGGAASGTRADASPTPAPDTGSMSSGPSPCGDRPCACDNGKDDDQDGLLDGFDPECTGPFDDDERSFRTGLPNNNGGKCRDCFWDNNAGKDDGCNYASSCLQGLAPTGGGSCSCDVSDQCKASCLDSTPNGCDCFGCCDVTRLDGSVVSVQLEDACSLVNIDDTTACPRCKQSAQCRNVCGDCELCPGRSIKELPASCGAAQPTGDHACDEGQRVCTADAACPVDFYCQLGCCLYVVP